MNVDHYLINAKEDVKKALKQLDESACKTLYLTDNKKVIVGALTDGDIRRHILNGGSLEESVVVCCQEKFITVDAPDEKKALELMLKHKINSVPFLVDGKMNACYLLQDLLIGNSRLNSKIDLPVVIMAGGKGTRLDPFTRILPKPLIPIGEKAAIEVIMDRFFHAGVKNFYLSVNYKAEMIKSYFENVQVPYAIKYLKEEQFLGTASSLKLLPANFSETFLLSNCDIFVDTDYSDLLKFHNENSNEITIVGAFQHFQVPYGVLEMGKNGQLVAMQEKPEFDFVVNSGVYVCNSSVITDIPENKTFSMVDLINSVKGSGRRVGVYPVSEGSYIDIGQWEEYQKNIKAISKDE